MKRRIAVLVTLAVLVAGVLYSRSLRSQVLPAAGPGDVPKAQVVELPPGATLLERLVNAPFPAPPGPAPAPEREWHHRVIGPAARPSQAGSE